MNIVLDLRAIYGHFAGTPFIQPRLASVNSGSRFSFRHGGHQYVVQVENRM